MKKLKTLWKIGFGIYGVVMLWLLFGQRIDTVYYGPSYWEQLRRNMNLVPFRTVVEFINTVSTVTNPYLVRHAIINLLGNIIMFVPLGFFLPGVWDKLRPFRRTLLYACGIIVVVEVIQLFTLLGSCDVDDLILNMVGVVIGYGCFCGLSTIVAGFKNKEH